MVQTLRHVAWGEEERILDVIQEEGVTLSIWNRPLPTVLARWLQRLAQKEAISLDMVLPAGAECAVFLFGQHPFRDHTVDPMGQAWGRDIVRCVRAFAKITGSSQVRTRLETVADYGCEKFHVNRVFLRLLCTYTGAGTQWVDNYHVQRSELGMRSTSSIAQANRHIVSDPEAIQTIATGAVAMLKGESYPGNQGAGIVHRSHPIYAGEEIRLRLCLDLPR
jgi:hypothetical protein